MQTVTVTKKPPGFGHQPFKGLKPLLAKPAEAPVPVPAKQVPRATSQQIDDARMFAVAVAGAHPLPDTQRRKVVVAADAEAVLADLVQGQGAFTVKEVGESVFGVAPGVNRRLLKGLRGGEYPVAAQVDLHGLSANKATAALERFLTAARTAGHRCVLVIHGRGLHSGPDGPVLMSATRQCLSTGRARRHVLAFVSAPPARGGTGALLVLLRAAARET